MTNAGEGRLKLSQGCSSLVETDPPGGLCQPITCFVRNSNHPREGQVNPNRDVDTSTSKIFGVAEEDDDKFNHADTCCILNASTDQTGCSIRRETTSA